jgi:hypothetical protein
MVVLARASIDHILPDNGSGHRRHDEYTYYEEGPQFGYLKDEIVDAPNLALTTTYEYDLVGNVIRKLDPKRNDIQFIVNQLDQVVRETSRDVRPADIIVPNPTVIHYEKDFHYDANDNLVREDIQNKDENGFLLPNTHFTTTYEYEVLNYRVRETREVAEGHNIVEEYAYDGNP